MKEELTQERLKELLDYDPETGVFTWLVTNSTRNVAGNEAGCRADGKVYVGVDGRMYRAHRLAWLYVHGEFPSENLDHVNRDWQDNRIDNLRIASQEENMRNRGRQRNNTTGYKGVSFIRRDKRYQAKIQHSGKHQHLGYFTCPREAAHAYNKAAIQLHGEFAVLNPI